MVGLSMGMMLAIIGFVLMVFLPFTLPETAGRDLSNVDGEIEPVEEGVLT
jgi:hypothetical protein